MLVGGLEALVVGMRSDRDRVHLLMQVLTIERMGGHGAVIG